MKNDFSKVVKIKIPARNNEDILRYTNYFLALNELRKNKFKKLPKAKIGAINREMHKVEQYIKANIDLLPFLKSRKKL